MISPDFLSLLAPDGAESCRAISLRIVRKRGEPLLLLPRESAQAVTALGLYPAQTFLARVWLKLLKIAVRVGAPLPAVALDLAADAPFVRFLFELEGVDLQTFAVSFGNPRAAGRRYLLLLFDRGGSPHAVVKVGADPDACRLIEAEANLLTRLPAGTPGVPVFRGGFSAPHGAAFAMDFVSGAPPHDAAGIEPLLASWLDRTRRLPLCEISAWSKLADESRVEVHAALMHGDFAPWNVRAHADRWTLIDWERGELVGVPGWDWLHFVVQRAVLVERLDAAGAKHRIEELLRSASFVRYAQAAGFEGSESLIARGYVNYCSTVLRPTERTAVFSELAALMPLLK